MPLQRYPAPPGSDEEQRRLKAYHATASDHRAAGALDLPWYIFRDWRRRMGLPAKGHFQGPLSPDDHARRLSAWQQEVMPWQAAQRVGCSSDALQHWARGQGLPAVAEHAVMLRDSLSDKDVRHWDAYCRFRTDLDAGRWLGTTMSSFRRWRIRQGLPGHSHTPAFYAALRKAAGSGNPIARRFLKERPQPRLAKPPRGA